MQRISGKEKTIRTLLNTRYTVDYYQREYKWETKQIHELIDDLATQFLIDYVPEHPRAKVAEYSEYFLGSIIISRKDNTNYIVDGQQRLTSLTLLLIFLRNLQRRKGKESNIEQLIFTTQYGTKSFNLYVPERTAALESLYEEKPFDSVGQPESIINILARYADIEAYFPDDLSGDALPYFVDWLVENVQLVEITAFSDDAAYTIFETMNDRGLSLTPADMLKGFLLANIADGQKKDVANSLWRARVQQLAERGKEVEPDFFKNWLRSQYANKIRERKKGAHPEEFDLIGTEFHRWVRQNASNKGDDLLSLTSSDDFFNFISRDFDFYSRQYLRMLSAASRIEPGLEHIFYVSRHNFTLQYMLLMAPLTTNDSDAETLIKQRLVAMYLDIMLARRIWNFRAIDYSTMQYRMFLVMRNIRGLAPRELAIELYQELQSENEIFQKNKRLRLHKANRWQLHVLLARITDTIERESGYPGRFAEYVNAVGDHRYEVEHIWSNHPEQHADEFAHASDFDEARNKIGGLLLLPKKFNASYGDLPYETKLEHYNHQNLLARSLHLMAYDRNPGFTSFIKRHGFPFRSHESFRAQDLDERRDLYLLLADFTWNPIRLLEEVGLEVADEPINGAPNGMKVSLQTFRQAAKSESPHS